MKSAYELAMERLEKQSGPTRKLTGEQKAQIADIDSRYEAKTAECRLNWENRIQSATSLEEYDAFKAGMAGELQKLESSHEEEKERVWNEA